MEKATKDRVNKTINHIETMEEIKNILNKTNEEPSFIPSRVRAESINNSSAKTQNNAATK